MKRFDYLTLGELWVSLYSSSESTLDWIADKVRELFPRCKIERHYPPAPLPQELIGITISKLDNFDVHVRTWILRELIREGWELRGILGNLQNSPLCLQKQHES